MCPSPRLRELHCRPGHEDTFLLCIFCLVDALLWLGREEEASVRINSSRALQNDVGLNAEELADDGAFLGNFPPDFGHLGFIHSALMLDLYEHGRQAAVQCIVGAEAGE
ncbi:hypothetical protein CLBKND_00990 [Methylorubrum aminovorans]